MHEIRYDSQDDLLSRKFSAARRDFDLTGKLVEWGLARDKMQSAWILIGVVIVAITVSFLSLRGVVSFGNRIDPNQSDAMEKMKRDIPSFNANI